MCTYFEFPTLPIYVHCHRALWRWINDVARSVQSQEATKTEKLGKTDEAMCSLLDSVVCYILTK